MREPPLLLIAEDDRNDVELILLAIRQELDARVVVAGDGQEALDLLLGTAAEPALDPLPAAVFLDLHLPKVGGLDVLRRLRERPPTRLLPVVILSSSDEPSDLVTGYGSGANSYVVKPVDHFADTVRKLTRYWLGINRALPRSALLTAAR